MQAEAERSLAVRRWSRSPSRDQMLLQERGLGESPAGRCAGADREEAFTGND
jgi:hypothetical protein